jgi:hypothetical protein
VSLKKLQNRGGCHLQSDFNRGYIILNLRVVVGGVFSKINRKVYNMHKHNVYH